MATITGTTATDTLTGTAGRDRLLPFGVGATDGPDIASGLNGRDTYDLSEPVGQDPVHRYVIDDNGTDGARDRIVGAGDLIHTASLGYQGFATALRDGDDLLLVTPSKPHRFRDPAQPSYEITIRDHYAGEAIEQITAGGITYRLPTGATGHRAADLMAGTDQTDTLSGRGGDDYITGNGGADTLNGGRGNDHLFGDAGNDVIRGQAGSDRIYAGTGNDRVLAGADADFVFGDTGNDTLSGQKGNDYLYGEDGDDILNGGGGQDLLSGGRGNDLMRGGAGGDTYRYGYDLDTLGTMTTGGHDTVFDKGEAPSYADYDRIELFGYYGPSSGNSAEAFARLSFDKSGTDMLLLSDGGMGSITVRDQFGAADHFVEELHFNAGYWTPLRFKILDGARTDIGDDRAYRFGEGGEWNEILFGTDGDDIVFGNSGTNFIWLGDGADTLIYKEADPLGISANGGGACVDIVLDFDVLEDRMDFTEIKGLTLADLTIGQDADGDATVYWDSGTWEVSDILIELRGVTPDDLGAEHFVFG